MCGWTGRTQSIVKWPMWRIAEHGAWRLTTRTGRASTPDIVQRCRPVSRGKPHRSPACAWAPLPEITLGSLESPTSPRYIVYIAVRHAATADLTTKRMRRSRIARVQAWSAEPEFGPFVFSCTSRHDRDDGDRFPPRPRARHELEIPGRMLRCPALGCDYDQIVSSRLEN